MTNLPFQRDRLCPIKKVGMGCTKLVRQNSAVFFMFSGKRETYSTPHHSCLKAVKIQFDIEVNFQ
jgi:hypothetical protein